MFIKMIKLLERNFEEVLCSLMIGYIAVALNIEVFNRYILFSPSAYTDEVVRMLMLFIVFIGVPWAVKQDRHIVIDLWPQDLSPKKQFMLNIASNGFFLIFAIVFSLAAIEAVEFHKMLESRTEALGFEYWIQLSVLPFSFILTCVRLIQKIYLSWVTYKTSGTEYDVAS